MIVAPESADGVAHGVWFTDTRLLVRISALRHATLNVPWTNCRYSFVFRLYHDRPPSTSPSYRFQVLTEAY